MPKRSMCIVACMVISLMTSGCGWWNTAFRDLDVDDGSGAMVDIKQRAIIVSKDSQSKKTIVCAEPSPDAMSAYASEAAGKINAYGKVNTELSGAFQESAAYTGLRTQSIQLLRDGFYRLCEGYMSGALDQARYDTLMRRYQRYMVALLGIEQLTGAIRVPPVVINTEGRAETAASISALRKEAEKIELELVEKRKEKSDLEGKIRTLADTDPKKEELKQQAAVLSTQIRNRETDLVRINKSIENAHGSIVSGSANAIVSIPPNLNERSDAHIQAVAEVVGGIVTNILDTDDTGQLCWAYLTTAERKDEKVLEACLNHLNSNAATRAKAVDLLLARARVQLTELERLPSTEKEGGRREALERQLTDSIRGFHRFYPRIVGGEDAEIKDTPWQVSIVAAESTSNLSGHFCGGSLIKPNWVLTAAHCVSRGTMPDQIAIISGTDDLRAGGERSSVKQIIIHGKYNANTNDNDIALLKLTRRVKASSAQAPIRLITAEEENSKMKAGETVLITGWGYTEENGEVSPKLQRATVPVVDRKTCNARGSYDGAITDNMLCAGHQEGGVDSCQADPGGPLAVKMDNDLYALAGVMSWGEGCAREDKPGVYARVSKYVKWINDHTK